MRESLSVGWQRGAKISLEAPNPNTYKILVYLAASDSRKSSRDATKDRLVSDPAETTPTNTGCSTFSWENWSTMTGKSLGDLLISCRLLTCLWNALWIPFELHMTYYTKISPCMHNFFVLLGIVYLTWTLVYRLITKKQSSVNFDTLMVAKRFESNYFSVNKFQDWGFSGPDLLTRVSNQWVMTFDCDFVKLHRIVKQ